MSFTSPHTIRGWFTDIPSWRGRVGIRILGFGLAARTFRLELASESASSEVLDGAGVIGDSTGTIITSFITTAGTSRGAMCFTTGTISTEEACEAEFLAAASQGTGPGTLAGAAESTTVPAQRIDPSTETTARREDTRNPAVRAGRARAPLAATTVADRPGAIPRAEAPASVAEGRVVAEEDLAVAAAGIDDRGFTVFPVDR
jgi:hypothetical protein